jgi:hypothetical protein
MGRKKFPTISLGARETNGRQGYSTGPAMARLAPERVETMEDLAPSFHRQCGGGLAQHPRISSGNPVDLWLKRTGCCYGLRDSPAHRHR